MGAVSRRQVASERLVEYELESMKRAPPRVESIFELGSLIEATAVRS